LLHHAKVPGDKMMLKNTQPDPDACRDQESQTCSKQRPASVL
jgi:hypothetical protein